MTLITDMIISPRNPLLKLSTELVDLCKPLEKFHIHHITYQKVFHDYTRVCLSNKPEWIVDYYNLPLYGSSLFEQNPGDYQADFAIWLGEYNIAVYHHAKQYYDSYYSITVTQPVGDGCEFYFFSTSQQYLWAINYLSNNREILYHFILYIKDRGRKLFNKATGSKIFIPNGNEISKKPEIQLIDQKQNSQLSNLKNQFLCETTINKFIFEDNHYCGKSLTQRELKCLHYLLQNKTSKEIANFMNIAYRTVESYLENIKIKLDCANRIELINKITSCRFLSAI